MSVRFESATDGTGRLIAKMSSGTGGYRPGDLLLSRSKDLTKEQTAALKLKFEGLKLWSLPTYEQSSGRDGARWIIEGSRNHDYHVVDRWTPPKGPVREFGLYFLTIAGLEIPDEKLY